MNRIGFEFEFRLDIIEVKAVLVRIAVRNLGESRQWYERLFGKRPDLEPLPGQIEFNIAGTWLLIEEGDPSPSSWNIRLEVAGLTRERERLQLLGIAMTEVKTVSSVINWFSFADPDGNSWMFYQVLTTNPQVTGKRAQG